MSPDSRIKPQPCYCCGLPLTFTRKTQGRQPVPADSGDDNVVESWECTNDACITYRKTHHGIPTPPLSK